MIKKGFASVLWTVVVMIRPSIYFLTKSSFSSLTLIAHDRRVPPGNWGRVGMVHGWAASNLHALDHLTGSFHRELIVIHL